jgi:hypothetical protein
MDKKKYTLDAAIYNVGVALRVIRTKAIVSSSRWYVVAVANTITSITVMIHFATFTAWLVRDGNLKPRTIHIA